MAAAAKSNHPITSHDTKKPGSGSARRVNSYAQRVFKPLKAFRVWVNSLQPRSPHRSFRRTLRRDYARSLELPGYVAFTVEVWRMIWKHKATFMPLIGIYALMTALFVGFASQSTYTKLGELLRSTSGDIFQGSLGEIGKASLLLFTGLSGGLNPQITQNQLALSALFVLLVWLTTVWLLRAFLAGQHPRMRDGLYNAGAPLVPTAFLGLLLMVQLIPAALVPLGVSAATATDPRLLSSGIEAMLFWTVSFLLALLSLYWITGTLIALVIVTLPGMYPMEALRTASSLVLGRRFRFLLRIIWLFVSSLIIFAVVMIPIIIFDAWVKGLVPALEWLPLVPISLLFVSSAMVVWMASYVYLLYRKVVDDDSE